MASEQGRKELEWKNVAIIIVRAIEADKPPPVVWIVEDGRGRWPAAPCLTPYGVFKLSSSKCVNMK